MAPLRREQFSKVDAESYVAPLRHTECAYYINGTGMGSLWDQLRHLFSGAQLPWMIVWLGLAVLIIGLIVLTRTNWGQSHPLQKCAAMSLLVHLLLAVYATTVQIVAAGSPEGTSDRAPGESAIGQRRRRCVARSDDEAAESVGPVTCRLAG